METNGVSSREKHGSRDLTKGSILKQIISVAVPVMGSQFVQMAYNLTDMFWLGRVGPGAVAASGIAGMFLWLSQGFLLVGRMGAEIGVAQSLGKGERGAALDFARNALLLNVILGTFYALVMALGAGALVALFPSGDGAVTGDAAAYLRIVSAGILPAFVTGVISGTFTASGNSRTPFLINSAGMALNVILDPLLILGAGMGIRGAAIATAVSQAAVTCMMLLAVKKSPARPFPDFRFRFRPDRAKIASILKWAVPVGLESGLFTLLTMPCTRMEAGYGPDALAAGKIGAQIESLTWLIGGGFGSALVAFIGQNHGAGEEGRIRRGVKVSALLMLAWGAAIVVFFCTLGGRVFQVFLPGPRFYELGRYYLWIYAACQIPMNLEAVFSGVFKGRGKTVPPSAASIVCNTLKPLLAWLGSGPLGFGLYGVWAGVCAADVLRGLWMCAWYFADRKFSRRPAA